MQDQIARLNLQFTVKRIADAKRDALRISLLHIGSHDQELTAAVLGEHISQAQRILDYPFQYFHIIFPVRKLWEFTPAVRKRQQYDIHAALRPSKSAFHKPVYAFESIIILTVSSLQQLLLRKLPADAFHIDINAFFHPGIFTAHGSPHVLSVSSALVLYQLLICPFKHAQIAVSLAVLAVSYGYGELPEVRSVP